MIQIPLMKFHILYKLSCNANKGKDRFIKCDYAKVIESEKTNWRNKKQNKILNNTKYDFLLFKFR